MQKNYSYARLSINIFKLLGILMKAYVITVVRGNGPEQETISVLMRRDNMLAVHWVQEYKWGKYGVRAGGAHGAAGGVEEQEWVVLPGDGHKRREILERIDRRGRVRKGSQTNESPDGATLTGRNTLWVRGRRAHARKVCARISSRTYYAFISEDL